MWISHRNWRGIFRIEGSHTLRDRSAVVDETVCDWVWDGAMTPFGTAATWGRSD